LTHIQITPISLHHHVDKVNNYISKVIIFYLEFMNSYLYWLWSAVSCQLSSIGGMPWTWKASSQKMRSLSG